MNYFQRQKKRRHLKRILREIADEHIAVTLSSVNLYYPSDYTIKRLEEIEARYAKILKELEKL